MTLFRLSLIISVVCAFSASASPANVYWRKGTRLDFSEVGFTTKINTLLQPRYTFTDRDSSSERGNSSAFDLNQVRIRVSGRALNKKFAYLLEVDMLLDGVGQEERKPILVDGFIIYKPVQNTEFLLGLFKIASTRQFSTHASVLQFPDRSAVSNNFTIGWKDGAQIRQHFFDKRLTLFAQAFNGFSDGEGINLPGVDTKMAGVVGYRYSVTGKMSPFHEGDVEWTEDLAVNIGTNYTYSESETNNLGTAPTEVDEQIINIDLNAKYKGLALHSEIFFTSVEDTASAKLLDSDPYGFYLQGGYFLIPNTLELVAKFGYIDCDDGTLPSDDGFLVRDCSDSSVDELTEFGVGLNYFWWGHHLKGQLVYDLVDLDYKGSELDDMSKGRLMLQLSSWF